jgi:DNA-binding helix-hairpin-helix protein with protein kinase domain
VTSFQKIIAENETCGKDVARDGSFWTEGRRQIQIVFYLPYFRGKPIIGLLVAVCRRDTFPLVAWFTESEIGPFHRDFSSSRMNRN